MLQFGDLRDTRVYREALEEGRLKGKRQQAVRGIFNMADRQMPPETIAAILEVDVEFVHQVLKGREEGAKDKAARVIVNLSAENFPPEKIAAVVEVDIEFVHQVLKERASG